MLRSENHDPTDPPVTIGSKIKFARLNAGMKRPQLAERVGVTPKTIENWEADSAEPPLKRLKAISNILGVPLQEFFDEIEGEADDQPSDPVELARRKLQEAAKLLGARVEFQPADEVDDPPPEEEKDPVATGLGAVARIAAENGVASRPLSAAVKRCHEALKPMTYGDLLALASERGIDLAGLPDDEAQRGLAPKERTKMEEVAESYLLCDAVYGDTWRNLDGKGFERAANLVRDNCYDGKGFVDSMSLPWNADKRLAQLRREISPHLICAIETGAGQALSEGTAGKKPASGAKAKRSGKPFLYWDSDDE